ncbi:putative Ig domain-containing protein [Polaromonas sp. YR568]|uniref:putative Ig domain-containing protein n=1 Tax=Polaromonas sp. YR568 TaxID=1855301 RepID=UPI003137CA80
MVNSQLQTYADMINLQVASEAFLAKVRLGTAIDVVLEDGNKNNSKEPNAIAELFVSGNPTGGPRYKLIAHQDLSLNATTVGELGTSAVQDKTGFSASVFFDTVNNQYTLSIRSTEYADSINDPGDVNADTVDILANGWAFSQILSMENFWNSLIDGSASTGVNGVTIPNAVDLQAFKRQLSSGATKINVTGYSLGGNLAEAFTELHRTQVDQTFLFNGAGTGLTLGGKSFQDVFNKYKAVFDNPLGAYPTPESLPTLTPYNESVHLAWEAFKLNPDAVYNNAYQNPRYVLALSAIGGLVKGAAAVTLSTFFNKDAPRTADSQINDLFAYSGASDITATASSGQRHGASRPIWYEEQPLSTWTNGDFSKWDWGQGHSIVLLQDSLNLMAAFERLDPSMAEGKLASFFQAASNHNYDSLEKALDALSKFVGLSTTVASATADKQFADMALRNPFFDRLKAIQDSPIFKALAGKATLSLADIALATKAQTNFAAFLSLNALSPVVISTADTTAIALLKQANETLAQQWEADAQLTVEQRKQGLAHFSQNWYTDRAAMLGYVVLANKDDITGPMSVAGAQGAHYEDIVSGRVVDIGLPNDVIEKRQVLFGSDGNDEDGKLTGKSKDDRIYGGAGDDVLNGQGGSDYLEGGSGTDTYQFTGTWGKDTILDVGGQGHITINGTTLGVAKATGRADIWHTKLDSGELVELHVLDFAQSSTGKKLLITREGDSANSITINNFDLAAARGAQGYLGIKLDPEVKVLLSDTNLNPFESWDFDPNTFTGQTEMGEGLGMRLVVWINQAFEQETTLTINVADEMVGMLQAILGDTKVDANGATITLAPGQTQVSFALVSEGDIAADLTGAISVSYNGGGQTATSNTWGLNVKDAGETAKTFIGDQRAQLWGVDLQPDPVVNEDGSVTQDIIAPGDPRYNTYAWSKTEWAADGTLTGGVAEVGFNDVIYGSSENDKIQGLGGNDALDGRGGNDVIDGGDGDDLIAGGAGSDHILGGAGNDVILSATTMVTPQRSKSDDPTDPARIVGNVIVNGGPLAMDTASDMIEAGDGDDEVYAGFGDDRMDGGNGTDVLYGLGGDDVMEGGAGNDKLLGDGVSTPATYGSSVEALHGSDFLDGGDGNDTLIGGGKGDVLYGGGGDDDVYGDTSGDLLAGQHHGDDYLDGEDGTDRLWGNGANDTLYGGAGNDKLYGDAKESELEGQFHGNDYLDGEGGDDELIGHGGNDALYGGGGKDHLQGDAAQSELAGSFNGEDYLDGEDDDDVLIGGGKADILYGGAGNDQLQGDGRVDELGAEFRGDDYLDGEDGDDVLIGDGGADTLYGGTGSDYLAGDNAAAPGAPNHLSGESHGNDYLDGGEGNDTLVGDGGADTLLGGAGNDILHGDNTLDWLAAQYHGIDFLDGGDGDDTLYGGGGDDVLQGGTGNDVLAGEAGADYMDGGAGDDTYLAGAGDTVADDSNSINTLTLVDGEPLGVTASGADLLLDYGPNGVLTLVGALTGNIKQINGVSTRDWISSRLTDGIQISTTQEGQTVTGGSGDDALTAYHADAQLSGGMGNDVLAAGEFSATLDGGAGNDVLYSGAGDDALSGGGGTDTYYVSRGNGADVIHDKGDAGSIDVLQFGEDILFTDVSIRRTPAGELELSVTGTQDRVTISNWYTDSSASNRIERIVFGDGTTLTPQDFQSLPITGTDGDDQMAGTSASDVLIGGAGQDTYFMSYGMGTDQVVDASPDGGIVQLAAGLDSGNLVLQRQGDNLLLKLGVGNSFLVDGYFAGDQRPWKIRDGSGGEHALADLVAEMPVYDTENEWGQVQQEEVNYRETLEQAVRNQYAYLDYYYMSPYVTLADGSIESHSEIEIYKTQRETTLTQQVQDYVGGGWTYYPATTSSTSNNLGLGYFSFYGNYEREVIRFNRSVVSSNEASITAASVQDVQVNVYSQVAFNISWGTALNPYWESSNTTAQFLGCITADGVTNDESVPLDQRLGLRWLSSTLEQDYYKINGSIVGDGIFGGTSGTAYNLNIQGRDISRTINIQTLELGDANNTVFGNYSTIVNAGDGDDVVHDAGYAYGGAGNDTLIDGGTLKGGDGNDWLQGGGSMDGGAGDDVLIGGQTMVASAGYDRIYAGTGEATIEVDPGLVTQGLVGGNGLDWSSFLDRYYSSIGIDNWEESSYAGGRWIYSVPETSNGHGVGTLEEVQAAIADIGWVTYEEALEYGWVYYVEPLPPAPIGSANDFRSLEGFYESGVLQQHTVQFGAGITKDDLQFFWSEEDVSIDGGVTTETSFHKVLNIVWEGGARSIGVIIPHSDEAIGSGISQFTFANGTVLSMADMLDLAPPVFTFDPHAAIRFEDGSGEMVLSGGTQVLGFEFARSELDVSRDGTDLLLTHSGTSDLVRLTDWYGQLGSYQGFKIKFSDDAALTSGDLTALGLIMDGSAGNQTLAGLDGYANTFIAGPNDILIAGDSGQDTFVFNAGSGTVHIQDSTGTGTIVFGAGITAGQISLGLGSLLIRVGNSGDAIHIDGFDPLDVLGSSGISTFKFANGEVMSLNEIVEKGFDIGDSMESDVLGGTNLKDRIVSVAGQDTLVGGRGNDTLMAGADVNVFVFEAGDGHDLIDEAVKLGANAGGDVVRFGAGISVGDMLYAFQGDRLIIMVNGKNNTVSVLGDQAIGRVEFADGSYQTYQSLGAQTALVTTYGPDGAVINALELSHDAGLGVTTGVVTSDAGQILSRYTLTLDADQAAHVDVYDGTDVKTESYIRLYSGAFISGEGWNSTRVDYDDGTAAIYKVRAQGATRLVRLASDGTVISDDLLNYEVADSNLDTVVMDPQSGEEMSGVLHAAVGGHSTLTGTSGFNTFVLGLGDGINVIDDSAASLTDGGDSIRFGVGIRAEDVRIDQVGPDLLLRYSADDYVVVRGMNLLDMDTPHYISNITFEGSPTASISIWKGSEDGESGYQISGVSEASDRRWGYYRGVDGGSSSWEEHLDESGERIYYDGTWRSADGTVSRYTRSGDTYEESYYEPNDGSSANFDFAGAVYRTGYGKDNEYAIWHEYDASNRLLGHGENHWQSIDFGGVISWTDVFDAIGRLLTHDWYDYPHGLMGWDVYGADGSVSKTTRNLWEGGYSVYTDDGHGDVHTVTYDSDGNLVSDNWEHTNAAPLSNIDLEDQAVQQGDAFDFQIPEGSFSDPDAGNELTYSATLVDGSPLPDWLAFDPATHKFSGVPPLESAGAYTVTLRVTDSWGAATQQDFALAVSAPSNSAPLTAVDLLTVQAGAQISASGNVLANDQDADPADTLSVMNPGTYESAWGSLVLLADGSYVYSLNADRTELDALGVGQSAQEIFSYSVTDGRDVTSGEMTITIQGSNDAPLVAAQVGERIATEDAAWSYTIPSGTFADVDSGDVLAYSVTQGNGDALPSWLHFDAQTATLSGTPGNADVGDLAVRITATDLQGVSASQVFNLSIANANDAPVVLLTLAPQTAVEQQPFAYTLPAGVFADIDAGDTLSYTLTRADGTPLPSWLTFNAADMTVSGTPTGEAIGGLDLLLIATDSAGATATQALHIGVQALPVVTGTTGNNTINAQAAGSVLMGLEGNDTLNGNTGGDKLYGGVGADKLYGLSGNDVLDGGEGNDRLEGGTGADQMLGGLGNDIYVVEDAGDVVTELADEGTDAVQSLVDYTLTANVENLTLTGTAAISGTGNELNNVITGNAAGNTLRGLAGNDTLRGGSEADTLEGGEGNDRLDGGAGADQLAGGLGNDTYVVDEAGDVVAELAGEGADTVQTALDYTLTANVENLTLTGIAAISGTGNELNNVITGNVAGNTLRGLGGNDTLRGGLEADILDGGEGNDRLDGGAGADQLAGGLGNDTYVVDEAGDGVTELADEGTDTVQSLVDYTLGANLENMTLTGIAAISGTGNELNNVITGNAAGNTLRGLAGNDTLRGGLEADTLEGGEGNDRLDGGAGADQLAGGAGNDVYVVDEAGDVVTELADEGTDTVQSLADYTLGTNLENLTLTGTAATSGTGNELSNVITGNVAGNTLSGLGGNDTLRGGLEADTLEGGTGNDRLEGGAGADIYLFARGEGQDTLVETDATAGVEDVLQFGHDITADQIWLRKSGNHLEISLIGSSDKVTVANWYLGADRHVEVLQLSDGRQLLDSQVQSLVQAMAAFTPPAAGQTTLPESYAATLTPVIAANWQ